MKELIIEKKKTILFYKIKFLRTRITIHLIKLNFYLLGLKYEKLIIENKKTIPFNKIKCFTP